MPTSLPTSGGGGAGGNVAGRGPTRQSRVILADLESGGFSGSFAGARWPPRRPHAMMEHAGRRGLAHDRADARRDHRGGRLPAAPPGLPVSPLRRRDGGHPKPLLRPAAAGAAATLVSRMRLERRRAARAERPDPNVRPPANTQPHAPLISPSS